MVNRLATPIDTVVMQAAINQVVSTEWAALHRSASVVDGVRELKSHNISVNTHADIRELLSAVQATYTLNRSLLNTEMLQIDDLEARVLALEAHWDGDTLYTGMAGATSADFSTHFGLILAD